MIDNVGRFLRLSNGWTWLSIGILFLLMLPIGFLFVQALTPPSDNWHHIVKYVLVDYMSYSLLLVIATTLLTIGLGVSLAWLVAAYDFPWRHFYKYALVLPLAIPPYIGAYTYHGLLSYTGVIQAYFRNQYGVTMDQKYFDIMTAPGAIFIFTLFLFPYVFLMTRIFLEKQSASLVESARVLGKRGIAIFFKVIIPISSVAWIGGGSLVAFEVLNDYGVVKYFGIPTFSTAIFTTWFGMGDTNAAVKLSMLLLIVVVVLLFVERYLRGRKKYHFTSTQARPIKRTKLFGVQAALASGLCTLVFALAFMIPMMQLIYWSFLAIDRIDIMEIVGLIMDTCLTAFAASSLIVIAALIVSNYKQMSTVVGKSIISNMTALGYSIPGAVIAIGVISVGLSGDRLLAQIQVMLPLHWFWPLFTGSLLLLILAYMIRFMTIAYQSIDSGYERIGNSFHEASRILGYSRTRTFFKVDLPLIRTSVVSAFLLVFIDLLKELPLTLILRPFNYNTLATKTFEYASDERIHEASVPSLVIICISLILILVINLYSRRKPGVH